MFPAGLSTLVPFHIDRPCVDLKQTEEAVAPGATTAFPDTNIVVRLAPLSMAGRPFGSQSKVGEESTPPGSPKDRPDTRDKSSSTPFSQSLVASIQPRTLE